MMTSIRRQTEITLDLLLQGFVADKYLSSIELHGLTSNSTDVKNGDLFVALSGLTRHAIDFASEAINAGAVAILYDANDAYCSQRIPLLQKQFAVSFIPVTGLHQKTGQIASRFYAYPSRNFKLIGITGTDGKTSVAHLLVQAFNKLNKKAGSVGTLGYGVSNNKLTMTHFTTPDAITLQSILFELSLAACEYVVMEVSSHALDQNRASGCEFDVAALTNLGSDHLDYHGDLAHYQAAKKRLFDMPNLSAKIVNLDDNFGQDILNSYKGGNFTGYTVDVNGTSAAVSAKCSTGIKLHSSSMTEIGIQVTVETPEGLINIQSALIGTFNVNNLLCCISILYSLGFKSRQIERCMQGLQSIPGRMEYFPSINKKPAVVIDFAHTEQALFACLNSLKNYCDGNIICIFGCGGDRDQSKRAKMAAVAEQLADQVIVTDDNPRNESPESIMRDILSGFQSPQQVRIIHDREVAIETAMSAATEKDLVVVAGKGHEQIQIIGDKRLPFSDHYVVKQIRKRAAE